MSARGDLGRTLPQRARRGVWNACRSASRSVSRARPATTVFLAAALLAGCGPSPEETKNALAAFETVKVVLQHPRCQNCHIPGDAPLQFDTGLPHQMNVQRGPAGVGAPGLPCSTCHGDENPPASLGANMPPGAPNWHLPPPQTKMVFIGLDSKALCEILRDGKQNGGKSLDQLLHHVEKDELVLWGWDPGVGRAPVSTPHADFVAAFRTWTAAGGPCP